jgi:broad specificity phosphatase PhoE
MLENNFAARARKVGQMLLAGTLLTATAIPVLATPVIQQLYLVRHAEKLDNSKDPQLSACGVAQAQALATLLHAVELPKLYHSDYQRTRQTAAANQHGSRQLVAYDPKNLAALQLKLTESQQNALVVGHSNTTAELATLLSKQVVPALTDTDYGRIYQLSHVGDYWSVQVLQLPVPAACAQTIKAKR